MMTWMQTTKILPPPVQTVFCIPALLKLPAASYNLRGETLFNKWQVRRENHALLPWRNTIIFLTGFVDITTSD
jgi:hypothetical protein